MSVPPPVLTAEDHAEVLECARYGELEDLSELLGLGADINYVNEQGTSALHMACANGHTDIVSLLLQRGARLRPNHAGNTPLHWACLNGHAGVVSVLLARAPPGEVDVYAKNGQGRSAFTVAISAGHDVLARSMLSHSSAEPPVHFGAGGGGGSRGGGGGEEGGMEEREDDDIEAEDKDLLLAPGGQVGGEEAALGAGGGGGNAAPVSAPPPGDMD
jgi:ankyrin repeat protein